MPSLITQVYLLLIIAISCGRARAAALDLQAGQGNPLLTSQYEIAFSSPFVLASGTTDQANPEFPVVAALNPGSGDLAEATSSERNVPPSSCSSKNKRGSANVDDTWCPYKPDSQTAPYTQPALDFNTGNQQQNSNGGKKWWQGIPGLQELFGRPTNKPIVIPDWLSQLCNDPEQFYIIPVCSLQDSYGGTSFMLNYCRISTVISCS